MAFSIITAFDMFNGIGFENTLPWHIPEDLNWFKKQTEGKTVIMGSNTYFSLPKKFRPLPKRENIVLTKDPEKSKIIIDEGGLVFSSIDELMFYCKDNTTEKFIIGGANIYRQFMNIVDKMYITRIDGEFRCDTFFPTIINEWNTIYKSDIKIFKDDYYYFEILEKIIKK